MDGQADQAGPDYAGTGREGDTGSAPARMNDGQCGPCRRLRLKVTTRDRWAPRYTAAGRAKV